MGIGLNAGIVNTNGLVFQAHGAVDAPTYNDAVYAQLEEVSAQKKYHNFTELLETNDIWEVRE